jgi:MFS family permease
MRLKIISQYKGLPRSIYVIVVARMLVIMGHFVYPFMATFLRNQFGYTDTRIMLYQSLLSLAYIPGALIGAKIADKYERKKTFVICMATADLFFIICGILFKNEFMLILLVVAFFFLNSSFPILTSMAMDLTTPANRQESFSLISIGLNLGFAIGPKLASTFSATHPQLLFFGQAFLNLSAVALVLFFIKDTHPTEADIKEVESQSDRYLEAASSEPFGKILLHSPIFLVFLVGACGIFFIYSMFFSVLPLQLGKTFGTIVGNRIYGNTCLINGAGIVLLAPFMVMLTKKNNPLKNLSIAALLYALGFGLYATGATVIAVLYLFAAIWTTGEVLVSANMSVFLANHAPITHRARFQSMYDVTNACGKALGTFLIGTFLMTHTYADVWHIITIIGVCCSVLFASLCIVENRQMKNRAAGH